METPRNSHVHHISSCMLDVHVSMHDASTWSIFTEALAIIPQKQMQIVSVQLSEQCKAVLPVHDI